MPTESSLAEQAAYDKALKIIQACRKISDQNLTLDLNKLRLTRVPPEIGDLTKLIHLELGNNALTTLPPEIAQLKLLRSIALYANQFATLPPEIFKLKNLQNLHVFGNHLTTVPPEIEQLKGLTSLSFADNRLGTLPPQIGQLKNLRQLFVSGNSLFTLPRQIGQLRTLRILDLADNQLGMLPPEMEEIETLEYLFLHGNLALRIPDSILGPRMHQVFSERQITGRPKDILNFYFSQRRGAQAGTLRAVNEIKVMLVGRGGAGKTSLRRFFMSEPHDKGEKETPGIALDSFTLRCAQGEVNVRLWDFAGQEITHALHQFFLTEGCVYVLVLDPRSNTEMRDAEYWLGLLKRYAGGAPVLVALNRQDARQGGYDVDRRWLQEKFPFIRSFTATNCEKREGCTELRDRFCEAVDSLKETEPPHLKVPESWLKVMKDCAGQKDGNPQPAGNKLMQWLGLAGYQVPERQGRQHLTIEEFRKICAAHGENDGAQQESLARLLHKLGAVLHFVDEPRLRDTTVLNPHWVTDGVYRLLRFKDCPGTDGILTLDEALKALPGEKEKEARFLLRLMERFEMCFPLDEEEGSKLPMQWLIPGALGEFQPQEITTDWQKPGAVRLRYLYDPLPEGVLPRFIVMTRLLSEGKPRWRNGVVLANDSAAALVRRGENRNHVEITAFGPDSDRLWLLEMIQGSLERIHSDLPDPKPVAEMELAGLPGTFRPVADLEAAELGRQKVAIVTQEEKFLIDPTPQLNQASEPEPRIEGRVPLNTFLSYSHEDKKAKSIFQQNLTVMTKKKLIMPWHDGLIEPGMRWREEIEENLGAMDIFVGLLTTAFLASDFIEKVEIKAAKKRLRKQGKDLLFVLILVDDISLEGLDLAAYQILKPGGKAVCEHTSRKAGFNIAQKELEKLILRRQEWRKRKTRPNEHHDINVQSFALRPQGKEGITVIVQGDYIKGNKPMTTDQSIHIGGNVTNAQIGQTLTSCTNMIQQQAPGERKDLLEELAKQVHCLIKVLPPEKHEEVADNLELAVKAVTKTEPKREWYDVSSKGLLEASKFAKGFSGNIIGTIKNLGLSLWPDFLLPGSKE